MRDALFGLVAPMAGSVLIGVLLVALLVRWGESRRAGIRARLGLRFPHSPLLSTALVALPALLMALSMMRPYLGSTEITVPVVASDYMFVVDVSRSMYARDLSPSRMELAARKISDLIDAFSRQGEPRRYGITLFAGSSYLVCPITDDTAVVKQFVREISPEMVTSLGSNLEAGLTTALSRFDERNARGGRILLVSDGEDDTLSVERASALIASKKIPVDVLGVGTTQGGPIPLQDGNFVRSRMGTVVESKLEERSLQAIAAAGSGIYTRVTLDDRDIQQLVKASSATMGQKTEFEKTIRSYNEIGAWGALAALVMLLLITRTKGPGALLRIAILLIPLSSASATPIPEGSAPSADPRIGFELYTAGRYDQARDVFKEALKTTPLDRSLLQAYASALFKSGNYKEAQEIFRQLASQTTQGREYFENTYNEGNALLALKRYRDAVDAFSKALDVKPDDERAEHNRAVARALLEEEERKAREATPTPTPTPPPSPQPDQTAQPSPSPQPSSESSSSNDNESSSSDSQDTSSQNNSTASSPSDGSSGDNSQSASSLTSTDGEGSASSQDASSEPPSSSPERLKENEDARPEDSSTPPPQQAQPSPPAEPSPLSMTEAEAWLESLPESPLLIRREQRRSAPGGQTW